MFKLHGILPPIATPFDHRGELYKVKVQHNVEKWNRTGLTGYVVCGSTGESVYLTTEEKLQMWEWVAEYAASDKVLLCGTGMESVRETVALTNAAAERGLQGRHGADAALLQESGAQDGHADAVLPRGGGPDQDPADDLQLAAGDRGRYLGGSGGGAVAASEIFAIKESSGNLEKCIQMIQDVKPGFQVLTGSRSDPRAVTGDWVRGSGAGVRQRRAVRHG